MHLSKLSLVNFKNYRKAEFELSDGVNCLVGNNGEGKTNVLDAIYYLSLCKSFFNPTDSQNIHHDEPFFVVQGAFEKDEHSDDIHCGVKRGQKKSFKRNKKDYTRLADHVGKYPVVMITPYDSDLIMDGSEIRRKLLDSIISQYDRRYLDELIVYNKTLSQRNALLKRFADKGGFSEDALEPWNMKLEEHGNYIFEQRTNFFNEFLPLFKEQFQVISGGREEASIVYQSQLQEGSLCDLLAQCTDRDRRLQYTTKGIHKDELGFVIDGHPVKKFASQGQQKSFLIAIKLAQYYFMKTKKDQAPILLLDDIFDKLDASRAEQLIAQVTGPDFGQVFITDTDTQRIPELLEARAVNARVFHIKSGEIEQETRIEPAIA